jgi:glutathione peroxidase
MICKRRLRMSEESLPKTAKTLLAAASLGAALASSAIAAPAPPATFVSVDGGTLSLADWAGRPVLVVNTASLCGFTPQYDAMQTLYERYESQGLVVLAVPSDDFRQELDSAEEVKEFCDLNFNLTFPMTDITKVKGAQAHPFYAWVKAETGFVPKWNFNKVLIGADGAILGSWGSSTQPTGPEITAAIEAALK